MSRNTFSVFVARALTEATALQPILLHPYRYGHNVLTPPKKPGFFARLWRQLNSVLVFILLAATVVTAALRQYTQMALVVIVVLVNVVIGMVQEGKAEKAAEAIKAMLSSTACVVRDGKRVMMDASQLVPGDVIAIKSGDRLPADVRLLRVINLQVQEAMLTGESAPVSKNLKPVHEAAGLGDRKCMAFSATTVSSGQGLGVVVATGDCAEIGKINALVSRVETVKTNLIVQMEILGRWLAIFVVSIALTAFLLALLHAREGFTTAFETAVAISVAMIPEGLPALVTIVLALGTKKMAANNAVIRQLPCVETLGSLTVICSDKTGTLTKNEMTVVAVRSAAARYKVTGVGYAPAGSFLCNDQEVAPDQLPGLQAILEGLLLCNDSSLSHTKSTDGKTERWLPNGAPTEVALITAGAKAGLDLEVLKREKPRVASCPFESEHKFMATVHQVTPRRRVLFVKGAPDRLLPMCCGQVRDSSSSSQADGRADRGTPSVEPLDVVFWVRQQEELSSQGLRVLALCRADLLDDEDLSSLSPMTLIQCPPFLAMVALVAILDPPRPEAIEAVKMAHRAGITVKMITGDHALTGLAIGRMLGIAGNETVVSGPQIDGMDDIRLREVVAGCNIFARASPENKLRAVKALQAGPGPRGPLDGDDPNDDGLLACRNTLQNGNSSSNRNSRCNGVPSRQVVAMTGDGVNDAPALKAADIGVAMGITGTDTSKEAAKMVLAGDNFATIVVAVREGRRVWDNLRKILLFNLPVNFAQGTCILWSYVIGFADSPLTAVQVLYVNMVTAVTMGTAIAAEPAEPDIMDRPPRRPGKRLLGKLILWRCFAVALLLDVLVLGMYAWALSDGRSLGRARAEAFNTLVFSEVGYCVTTRFIKRSSFHPRVFRGNVWCAVCIVLTIALQVMITYVPGMCWFFEISDGMAGVQWIRVIVCMIVTYIVVEIEKALVDPLLMPCVRPIMDFIGDRTPAWLRNPARPFRPIAKSLSRMLTMSEPSSVPSAGSSRDTTKEGRGTKKAREGSSGTASSLSTAGTSSGITSSSGAASKGTARDGSTGALAGSTVTKDSIGWLQRRVEGGSTSSSVG